MPLTHIVPSLARSRWQSWDSSVSTPFPPCPALVQEADRPPALFGFFLSSETNPWIDRSGYQNAYGAIAGISAAVLIMWIPLFYWDKRMRHSTWTWPVMSFVHWDDDREVGE